VNRHEELKRIEGSGYGCLFMGFLDGAILLLQRLLNRFISASTSETRDITQPIVEFLRILAEVNVPDMILSVLSSLNPRSEISPKGFISLLTFIHDAIYCEFRMLLSKVFTDVGIRALAGLLKES
jgi:fused-like protein